MIDNTDIKKENETPSLDDMASQLESSQRELRRSKDFLEGILESTADIIIAVNPFGEIITINKGAEKTLGYDRSEVEGKRIIDFFANPEDREKAMDKLNHDDIVVNYETRFKTKDGEIRDVLLTISRLRNRKGEILANIGISKDITREKRLQKQLLQSQRYAAIGEVFTGLQHSMKNMLHACQGGSYMIKIGLKRDDKDML